MGKSYTSKPRTEQSPIDFELDGVTFWFVPGKKSDSLVKLMEVSGVGNAKALMDWLGEGLNRYDRRVALKAINALGVEGDGEYVDPVNPATGLGPQAALILANLKSDDTDLELDTVIDIVKDLITEVSARPTGQPRSS